MISIARIKLDDELANRLDDRTAHLKANNFDSSQARTAWRSADTERRGVRTYLEKMAPGIQRCMYCGDNLGTDIDHFEPISSAPMRTFEWLNHLLACSHCNSNQKRSSYPRDLSGRTLLIDPTSEDPSRHLTLTLSNGEYRALTSQGQASIDVFGLNRADLTRGRAGAFHTRRATLCRAKTLFDTNRHDETIQCLSALVEEPHASVLHAMIQSMRMPGAIDLLGADAIAALEEPLFIRLLKRT
jgi:uncharacterized protein (TIGR02646 family)